MSNPVFPEVIEYPFETVLKFGSSVTCAPPVIDTDVDWVCLVRDRSSYGILEAHEYLIREGFTTSSDYKSMMTNRNAFASYRKGRENYVLLANPLTFQRYALATAVCKKLNLLKKADRITVFEAIINDRFPI